MIAAQQFRVATLNALGYLAETSSPNPILSDKYISSLASFCRNLQYYFSAYDELKQFLGDEDYKMLRQVANKFAHLILSSLKEYFSSASIDTEIIGLGDYESGEFEANIDIGKALLACYKILYQVGYDTQGAESITRAVFSDEYLDEPLFRDTTGTDAGDAANDRYNKFLSRRTSTKEQIMAHKKYIDTMKLFEDNNFEGATEILEGTNEEVWCLLIVYANSRVAEGSPQKKSNSWLANVLAVLEWHGTALEEFNRPNRQNISKELANILSEVVELNSSLVEAVLDKLLMHYNVDKHAEWNEYGNAESADNFLIEFARKLGELHNDFGLELLKTKIRKLCGDSAEQLIAVVDHEYRAAKLTISD